MGGGGVTRQAVSKKMPAGGAKNEKKAEKKDRNHKGVAVSVFMGSGSRSPGQELLFGYHCWQERAQRSLRRVGGWKRGWALGKPWVSGRPASHVSALSEPHS